MSEEVWVKIKKASHVLIAEVWYWFIILILSTFVIMLDKKFKSILFTISNFQIPTITENLVCNSKICSDSPDIFWSEFIENHLY